MSGITSASLLNDDFEHVKGIISEVAEIEAAVKTLNEQKKNLISDKLYQTFSNKAIMFFKDKNTKKLSLYDVIAKYTAPSEYESFVALKGLKEDDPNLFAKLKRNTPEIFKTIYKKPIVKFSIREEEE